jgi:hypothetical protein
MAPMDDAALHAMFGYADKALLLKPEMGMSVRMVLTSGTPR